MQVAQGQGLVRVCALVGSRYHRVQQGCVMSPWLFNVFMDKIVREGMENFVGGVKMSTTELV